MNFKRGDLEVHTVEDEGLVTVYRADEFALSLNAEELAWFLWGPGSVAMAQLQRLRREAERRPAAAADGPALPDGTDAGDGQMTMGEAHAE